MSIRLTAFKERVKKGRPTGLEPATFGTTIQRSSQLSYDRHEDGC